MYIKHYQQSYCRKVSRTLGLGCLGGASQKWKKVEEVLVRKWRLLGCQLPSYLSSQPNNIKQQNMPAIVQTKHQKAPKRHQKNTKKTPKHIKTPSKEKQLGKLAVNHGYPGCPEHPLAGVLLHGGLPCASPMTSPVGKLPNIRGAVFIGFLQNFQCDINSESVGDFSRSRHIYHHLSSNTQDRSDIAQGHLPCLTHPTSMQCLFRRRAWSRFLGPAPQLLQKNLLHVPGFVTTPQVISSFEVCSLTKPGLWGSTQAT